MRDLKQIVLIFLGSVCVLLGLVGIFIPVLPTTPLLLLAAYFFARSSNRALKWLTTNRWFGPNIQNYREGRGMTIRNKLLTLASLWIAIGLTTIFVVENGWVRFMLLGVASGVTIHILRIKTYRPDLEVHLNENAVETK